MLNGHWNVVSRHEFGTSTKKHGGDNLVSIHTFLNSLKFPFGRKPSGLISHFFILSLKIFKHGLNHAKMQRNFLLFHMILLLRERSRRVEKSKITVFKAHTKIKNEPFPYLPHWCHSSASPRPPAGAGQHSWGVAEAVPRQCTVAKDQDAVTVITVEVIVHGPIHNRIACILLISI